MTQAQHSAPPVFSLQKRLMRNTLLISLLSGLLSLLVVVAVVAYDSNELFDDILEENAKLLVEGQSIATPKMRSFLNEYNEEFDLDYQIIQADGSILSKSPHAANEPFISAAEDDEYYTIRHHKRWWRVYVLKPEHQNLQIQIAQPWVQRFDNLLAAIGHFLWLMLLLGLLSWLGTWFAIRRGIKALNHVSEQISQKNVQNLSALQPTQMMLELQPVVDSVNHLLQHLQQALLAEQQFTADAAHELRTPLAAIQMKLQLLQRKHQQRLQPIQSDLQQLENEVKRSTAVIENLLLLARLDPEDSRSLSKSKFVLVEMLQELLRHLEPMLQQKNIHLQCEWELSPEQHLFANRELCFSALRNLLDNALRYSHAGGRVRFKVYTEAAQLHVQIQDEGIGVDAASRANLGKRFFRVLGTEQQGSGLGLAIVSDIVKLHQGKLKFIEGLSAEHGFGVWLILPLED